MLQTSVLLLMLFAGGVAGTAQRALGQEVAESVTARDGTVLFQVGTEGGLLAPGVFGRGALSAEGAGTRLLWHPGSAAFRAGRVGFGMSDGGEWNEGVLGAYSAAFGVNTEASGRGTTAFGQGTTASGEQALSAGYRSTARGLRSVALGDMTTARGSFSTALGLNTTAQAYASVALGQWNETGGASNDWLSSDPLLVAGNGTGPSDRSNALLLRKNGNLTIAGTLTEHSDRRLKTNLRPLGSVSDELLRLRPLRFRFTAGTGHSSSSQIGLLAQDVRAVFPSLVREGPDGLLSLAYPRLTAVLLKGYQEQQTRIDSLQRRLSEVERLAHRQNRLAQEVAALKHEGAAAACLGIGPRGAITTGLLLLVVGGIGGAVLGRQW